MCPMQKSWEITALCTTFLRRCEAGFDFTGESHPFWELVVVERGTVGIAADDRVCTLTAGDAVLHPPMEFHRIWAADGTAPQFSVVSFMSTLPDDTGGVYRVGQDGIDEMTAIRTGLETGFVIRHEHIRALRQEKRVTADIAVRRLENLLSGMLDGRAAGGLSDSSLRARQYEAAVQYLQDNLSRHLTADTVAAELHCSQSALKPLFRRYAGIGMMEYHTRLRIRQAIRLLEQGMSVKEVSFTLGFSDPNYFSTVFKRITGESPRHYITERGGQYE